LTDLLHMTFYNTDIIIPEKAVASHTITTPKCAPTRYRQSGKRFLDIFLVVATAPITILVIIVLALAILVTGQNPFYIQKRVGRGGRTFRMIKLQTMLPNADERLETYLAANPEARAEWDSKQKLMNDPRITPLGNFLRKTSLDELPQLFNVANGTMSLVGPRPMMLDQKEQYPGKAYYRLRPGMTGLWQVSDRNSCEFVGRVRFDDTYDCVVSFRTDISVIAQTVKVILRATGI
jgi:exopolysaccharide production protein ExoY